MSGGGRGGPGGPGGYYRQPGPHGGGPGGGYGMPPYDRHDMERRGDRGYPPHPSSDRYCYDCT